MIKNKEKTIKEAQIHEKDTGSADVQISLLSKSIASLQDHLKKHPKDLHSRRGLLKMVIKRKNLLKYLKKKNEKRHEEVLAKNNLKK